MLMWMLSILKTLGAQIKDDDYGSKRQNILRQLRSEEHNGFFVGQLFASKTLIKKTY